MEEGDGGGKRSRELPVLLGPNQTPLNSWDLIIPKTSSPALPVGACQFFALFSSSAHFCDASFPSPTFSHFFQLVSCTPEGQRSGVTGTFQKTWLKCHWAQGVQSEAEPLIHLAMTFSEMRLTVHLKEGGDQLFSI